MNVIIAANPMPRIIRSKGANAIKVCVLLQARTNDAFRLARRNNYSYRELNNILCDIRESPEWIGAPKHVITYMKGYMAGAYNYHIASHPYCIPPK